jgi:cytoskeleton protein RodZ
VRAGRAVPTLLPCVPLLRSANDAVNFAAVTTLSSVSTPREFGAALRAARERSGIGLDIIADRTKIARRVLDLLEAGEYAKLPNRVFVRLFLHQYLAIIGERPDDWTPAFEATWQRFEDASQPWEVAPPAPSRGARAIPWVIGGVVAIGGLAAVVLVEQRHAHDNQASARLVREVQPTAVARQSEATAAPEPPVAATATVGAPAPPTAPAAAASLVPSPPATPTALPADPNTLVLRALSRACWVEVKVAGGRAESRLLAANSEWRVAADGQAVAVTAGDGGSLQVEYLGKRTERLGTDGEVVRVHLGPAPPAAERAP